jgi:hypothetical protein
MKEIKGFHFGAVPVSREEILALIGGMRCVWVYSAISFGVARRFLILKKECFWRKNGSGEFGDVIECQY